MAVVQVVRPHFSELKQNQRIYGSIIGVPVDGTFTLLNFIALLSNSFWVYLTCSICTAQGFYEHSQDRGYLFADCLISSGVSLCISLQLTTYIYIGKRQEMAALYQWCEDLYIENDTHFYEIFGPMNTKLVKHTKIIRRVLYGNVVFELTTAMLTKAFLDEALTPTPLYASTGWVQQNPWFYILCFPLTLISFYTLLNHGFSTTTYMIFCEHIVAQLEYIMKLLEIGAVKKAHELHVDVIDQIKKVSDLFGMPTLLNELCTVSTFVLGGLIIVQKSEFQVALVLVNILISCVIFSHFGERISESSQQVSQAIYELEWLEMTLWDQKQLRFMMQMAQKPTGVKAGGFHFVSYQQYSEILRLGYSILLAIVNTVKDT